MADSCIGLLLIPQIGRKKYQIRQTQYGRNMLIGEYLWMAYCLSLPPGTEPDPKLEEMRERKKVSSHIQVLKNFFSNHRCCKLAAVGNPASPLLSSLLGGVFTLQGSGVVANTELTTLPAVHFVFGQRREGGEKDDIETESLKNNSVLVALAEGRLPDETPNYEYFGQILALNEQVQFRPKRCWIFVSHQDVVVSEDRAGYLPTTSSKLGEGEYPHLGRNLERETWAKEEQQFFKGALLHEFTKEMHQVHSSSVKGLSKKWESAFPELHQRLKAVTSTTTDARCDLLHLHATLELNEKRNFPAGSSLSSWVEINIEQPRLLNHRWRVETRLVRPDELSCSNDDSAPRVIHEQHKEFILKYQHRPGCDGSRNDGGRGNCDCLSQRSRRDGVMVPFPVPFPADAWAQTLTNCAEYPPHTHGDKRHGRDCGPADDEEKPKARRRSKQPTQMDLVPKIAMMQEVFSCPPASAHEEGSTDAGSQRWTRRSVILWTFETIHSLDKDGKLTTAQCGRTDWRFLTILDPSSECHKRQAVINERRASAGEYRENSNGNGLACASRPESRGPIVTPSPTYPQPLGASISEDFSSTWGNANGLGSLSSSAVQAAYGAHFMSQTMPPHAATSQGGYGLLDSFSSHSDLSTPPPSASLACSFGQSFDTASTGSDIVPNYLAAHAAVTTAGMGTGSHTLGGGLSAMADPFIAHVGATYGEQQDGIHGWNSHHISGGIDPSASWSSGYSVANAAHGHGGVMGWTGSQPATLPSRRGSEQHHRHHHQHSHGHGQHESQHRQEWVSTVAAAANIDGHGPWTPLTSPDTPGETAATQAGSHEDHHNTTATAASTRDASQEHWVHLHGSSTASAASDLSQDWEEVVPGLAGIKHSPSPPPPPPPPVGPAPVPAAQMQQQQLRHQQQHGLRLDTGNVRPLRTLKRERPDSFGGEEEYRESRARS